MEKGLFIVDAFTDKVFGGNPAAVCPLDEWLPDDLMQDIAAEYSVSETAFFAPDGDDIRIRWFTPTVEMDLCGHATLASAHIIFETGYEDEEIRFESASGPLSVKKDGDIIYLDFPARLPEPCDYPAELIEALGIDTTSVLAARDYLVVCANEDQVRYLQPDIARLATLDKAVIVTAPGEEADFVSRFFCPNFGIDEDPVTGSSHCTLIPYWADRLEKQEMTAQQLSKRGGSLYCRNEEDDRVKIGGRAVTYLRGMISI